MQYRALRYAQSILGGAVVEGKFSSRYKGGMEMSLKTDRTLCTAKEAAKIFGCTVCRIRQLAQAGEIWSFHLNASFAVLDLDEITKKAKEPVTRGRPRSGAKLKRA